MCKDKRHNSWYLIHSDIYSGEQQEIRKGSDSKVLYTLYQTNMKKMKCFNLKRNIINQTSFKDHISS